MTKIPARAEISAWFELPGLKFQTGQKLSARQHVISNNSSPG
jgi:hypothetical protein